MGSLRLQQPQRTVNLKNYFSRVELQPRKQCHQHSSHMGGQTVRALHLSSQSGGWNSSTNNKQLPGFGQTFNGGNNSMFSNNSSGNKKIDIGAEVDNVMKEQISKHNWNAFFNEFKKRQ